MLIRGCEGFEATRLFSSFSVFSRFPPSLYSFGRVNGEKIFEKKVQKTTFQAVANKQLTFVRVCQRHVALISEPQRL
jgi:hypothetical protein